MSTQAVDYPMSEAIAAPRAAQSEELAGLTQIYQDDVNFAVWQRVLENELDQAVAALLANQTSFSLSEIVTPDNVSQALERSLPDVSGRDVLIRDIALLVDAYCCLFDADTAGLRLTQVDRAMCPRFHVDQVPCRLITTYAGPATQWLSESDLNRQKLGRGSNGLPDSSSGLISGDATIQQISAGDVALLKGERWEGNEGRGIVHRSPGVEAGQQRLLMTLDMA
ncbi:DUF1826 domain-containing protein [Marinomonas ostreistagni]|uniref:DUF1826 domain-containing protein n=1 Tax=Marinomonas ostreistagni TaxID=359209 RepID=UPI001951B3FB|nr:DUF1826 domain-containing protein [Marinomonas ostreistagni]MBM6550894.1 DUF1826 domain-containing protein [Marinomonas ostreistagni]